MNFFTLLFSKQGYSAVITLSTYAAMGFVSAAVLAICLLLSVTVAWPDWRGPRLFVRDVYKFDLPASCAVLRDERGTETF